MSQIIKTSVGRFRRVTTGKESPDTFLFECPKCGQWAYLDEDQWAGRISVQCPSEGCSYHETHEYGVALVTTIQAAILMEQKPYSEDAP